MTVKTESPGRARRLRLAAVVLASLNYGEADLLVTFLTRELGLVTALAKYGRRSRRRFGGGLLAPGVAAWYDFTLKSQSSLAFVENAEENPRARRLPPEPVIQALAAWALELVRGFETPHNPAEAGFRLLVRHLSRLSRCREEKAARLVALDFSAKYLELAGFGAALTACLACGAPIGAETRGWRWDPAAAGLFCPRCQGPGRPIPPGLMARLASPPPDPAPELTLAELAEAETFFDELAAHQLGRPLKALKVARRLFQQAPPGP